MASVKLIEETILRVAGNPVAGPIREWAREAAEAVAKLDEPEAKSKRVVDERETR